MAPQVIHKLYVPFLITGMLLTGCSNSIFTKYQDNQCVENCSDSNPSRRVLFEQPVWQTLIMFIGEMLCFLPVIYSAVQAHYSPAAVHLPNDTETEEIFHDGLKRRTMSGTAILLMWIPAVCDLTGTTLMMIGLLYTPVSIYQMTRGALVLWVGLFSVLFLRRRLYLYQWLSLVTVMAGVSLVGLAGSLAKDSGKGSQLLSVISRAMAGDELPAETTVFIGILFILFAQIFTATQFVSEEKIMSVYSIHPLLAVGYEGFFGALTILIFLPILISNKSATPFFDLGRGWNQLIGNTAVLWSSVASAISIALFNAFGLSVTRHVSATARSTADTCRTIGIWIVSLLLGWERLVWPWTPVQLSGFALLVYGTFVFNDLTEPPSFLKPITITGQEGTLENPDERRALLAEQSLEETSVLPANLGGPGLDVLPQPTSGERR